jgi:hypothetical protein
VFGADTNLELKLVIAAVSEYVVTMQLQSYGYWELLCLLYVLCLVRTALGTTGCGRLFQQKRVGSLGFGMAWVFPFLNFF